MLQASTRSVDRSAMKDNAHIQLHLDPACAVQAATPSRVTLRTQTKPRSPSVQ